MSMVLFLSMTRRGHRTVLDGLKDVSTVAIAEPQGNLLVVLGGPGVSSQV